MTVLSSRRFPALPAPPDATRPVLGALVTLIGIAHLGLLPRLHGQAVRSILADGVLGSVDRRGEDAELRGHAFWYATCGVALLLLGAVIGSFERRADSLPAWLGWSFALFTVWGVAFVPRSGFWAFLVPAALALARSRVDLARSRASSRGTA